MTDRERRDYERAMRLAYALNLKLLGCGALMELREKMGERWPREWEAKLAALQQEIDAMEPAQQTA